jgi:hypothetical protein
MPGTNRGATQSDHPTASLADLDISKQQNSDWQRLAAFPQEQFEMALVGDEMPTTSGIIRQAPRRATPPTPFLGRSGVEGR